MIDKIFKIILEAEKAGLDTNEFYRIAENGFQGGRDRKLILTELQEKLAESIPVLILGREGCSGCEKIKKDADKYLDVSLFSEYLELISDENLSLPIILVKGEIVADGEEIEKIKTIVKGD